MTRKLQSLNHIPDLYVEIVSIGNVSRVDYEYTIGSSNNNPQNAGIIVITKEKDKNAQKTLKHFHLKTYFLESNDSYLCWKQYLRLSLSHHGERDTNI